MNDREFRGRMIAEKPNQITRLSGKLYRVVSQSGHGLCDVTRTKALAMGWIFTCADFAYREVKCKHIWACEISLAIRQTVEAQAITIQPVNTLLCPSCSSEAIVRDALRHSHRGDIQRYLCKACGRRFSFNLGFEKMKASPQAITSAMQLYFTGESLRNAQKFLRLQGINVSHVSIHKWVQKYVGLIEKHLAQIKPQLSDTWRADEMWMKFKGNPKYLYALLDD